MKNRVKIAELLVEAALATGELKQDQGTSVQKTVWAVMRCIHSGIPEYSSSSLLLTTYSISKRLPYNQGCIFRLTCSHRELTKDHVLTSAYVKIFRTVTRNAVNRGG